MRKISEEEIPEHYSVCEHDDCPRASRCLHQIAYLPILERKENTVQLLNPRLCTKDERCPYFNDSTPVVFARGLLGMQARMLPGQYKQFMNTLIVKFNRTYYFQWRRGDLAISPQTQEVIRKVLRQAGVTEPLEFDSYEENYDW